MSDHRNSTALPTVSIGGVEIQPLAYKSVRVITTELLAKEFGSNPENLTTNFNRNKIRFVEGVHFFRISGDELKAIKNDITFSKVVGIHASQLTLWTERGVFRHAKILETDEAWNAYERLEDIYFAVRDGKLPVDAMPLPQKLKAVGDVMHGFSRLAGLLGLKGNQRALSAAMATHRETGVNVLELTGVSHLKADLSEQFLNSTAVGERTDPSKTANEINLILEKMGLQAAHRIPGKRPGKMRIAYWDLTDKGRKIGGDVFDTGKKDFKGRAVKQIMWPTSVIALVQDHMNRRAA